MATKTKARTRRTRSAKRGVPKPRRGAAFTARRGTRRPEPGTREAEQLHERTEQGLPAPGAEDEWST